MEIENTGFPRLLFQYVGMKVSVLTKQQIHSVAGSPDSLLVELRTRGRKVASSNPGRNGGKIFFSKVKFVC